MLALSGQVLALSGHGAVMGRTGGYIAEEARIAAGLFCYVKTTPPLSCIVVLRIVAVPPVTRSRLWTARAKESPVGGAVSDARAGIGHRLRNGQRNDVTTNISSDTAWCAVDIDGEAEAAVDGLTPFVIELPIEIVGAAVEGRGVTARQEHY